MKFEITKKEIGAIEFNKEEIKKELQEQLNKYKGLVIVDESQVGEFKTIRANLNKVSKVIDDHRKIIKQEYCQPLIIFENDIKELTGLVNDCVLNIDSQIKVYEQQARESKTREIEAIIDKYHLMPYKGQIWNDRWLNVTISLKSIEEEIEGIKSKITSELATLKEFAQNPIQLAELEYEYNHSLDLPNTIANFKRKQSEVKERAKTIAVEQKQADERKYLLKFEITATKTQIALLSEFLRNNAIDYKQIKEGGDNNGNQ